jgi:hypothetical protein
MQIKKGLEQFSGESVLLIVAGDRRGKVYSAKGGNIELVEDILVQLPSYDEKKSFYGSPKSGKGSMVAGSSAEINRPEAKQKFARALAASVKAACAGGRIGGVYLFGPSYMHSILEKALPSDLRSAIRAFVAGNHLHAHPFDLILKIQAKSKKGDLIISEKARKMLKRG